jgi:RNA polymerase sigma-70 factor (ECF subfamily)
MNPKEATQLVTELFESGYPIFLRYALRATGRSDVAEDLVQEAFMQLYKAVRTGKQVDNPKAWTFCVIRRLIIKQIRTHQRKGALQEPLSVLDDLPASAFFVAPPVSASDDEVTKLFSVLTPREEEVTLLRMTSLKYREIAEQLGISPKSVNTLLARALRKLQKAAGVKGAQGSTSQYVEFIAPKTLQ